MSKPKEAPSTRQMLGIQTITDHSLVTEKGELVFFMLKPTNISVLSDSNIGGRIYALMNVLKGLPELEMLCLNSKESFEENKGYLKNRMDQEDNRVIAELLKKDSTALDHMQVCMATAREFLIVIRLKEEKETEVQQFLMRIEKSLKDQGFVCKGVFGEKCVYVFSLQITSNVIY